MRLFWDYFYKTLKFMPIMKEGPNTQICKGGAESLDAARNDILRLRDAFIPERCDFDYLRFFAAARGLKRWSGESEELWRQRITHAYFFQRQGGRISGMAGTLSFFADVEIYECHKEIRKWLDAGGELLDGNGELDGVGDLSGPSGIRTDYFGRWAQFCLKVRTDSDVLDLNTQKIVKKIVNEIKPARSKLYEFLFFMSFEFQCRLLFSTESVVFLPVRSNIFTWELLDGDGLIDGIGQLGDLGCFTINLSGQYSFSSMGQDRIENEILDGGSYRYYLDGSGYLDCEMLDGEGYIDGNDDLTCLNLDPGSSNILDGTTNLGLFQGGSEGLWFSARLKIQDGESYTEERI